MLRFFSFFFHFLSFFWLLVSKCFRSMIFPSLNFSFYVALWFVIFFLSPKYLHFFLLGIPFFLLPCKTIFSTTQHYKSTVRFHCISTSHHCWVRRIRSFLLPYQRSQQAGWVAASVLIVAAGMVAPEWGQGAWWCLAWVDTPCPWRRSPWTSGTVRGQKRGEGCCRPSGLHPSGRTRPQRAPTASRSTSQKLRLDSEHKDEVSPTRLLTYPHPSQADLHITVSVFLWAQFWICGRSSLFILCPPFSIFLPITHSNYKPTFLVH